MLGPLRPHLTPNFSSRAMKCLKAGYKHFQLLTLLLHYSKCPRDSIYDFQYATSHINTSKRWKRHRACPSPNAADTLGSVFPWKSGCTFSSSDSVVISNLLTHYVPNENVGKFEPAWRRKISTVHCCTLVITFKMYYIYLQET